MEQTIVAIKAQFNKNTYSNEFIVAYRMCGWWMPYVGDNNALEFHLLGRMCAVVLEGEEWRVETGKTGFESTKSIPAENFDDACEKFFAEISLFDKVLQIRARRFVNNHLANLDKQIGELAVNFPFVEESKKLANLLNALDNLELLAKVYPPHIVRKICKRI